MPDPDRGHRPHADGDWRETDMERLRQERDALQALLATLQPLPHGTMSAEGLRLKREWCRVQLWRAAQQRRKREESA